MQQDRPRSTPPPKMPSRSDTSAGGTAEYRRPRRGWQRITARSRRTLQPRTTLRRNAPSPAEEILAKHDAELADELIILEPESTPEPDPEPESAPPTVITF